MAALDRSQTAAEGRIGCLIGRGSDFRAGICARGGSHRKEERQPLLGTGSGITGGKNKDAWSLIDRASLEDARIPQLSSGRPDPIPAKAGLAVSVTMTGAV